MSYFLYHTGPLIDDPRNNSLPNRIIVSSENRDMNGVYALKVGNSPTYVKGVYSFVFENDSQQPWKLRKNNSWLYQNISLIGDWVYCTVSV